jgi:transporter family protein
MSAEQRTLLFAGLTILLWGLWGFFGKLALERRMAPANIFIAEVLISAVCALPVFLALYGRGAAAPGGVAWNVYGLASGGALALGLLFYYFALEQGSVSLIVPLTSVYPAVSVLLSLAVLRERPTVSQWLGIALVVAGVALLLSSPSHGTARE